MKFTVLAAALAVATFASPAAAGQIESACNRSDRAQANPRLCACIQQAADLTLSRRDQARAADFFRDPHRAQEVRQSSRRGDADFWLRYRSFGDVAEVYCGGA